MEWHDFGQTVSLTSRIRELLLLYPEGTSIFKELIQNADDARAKSISLCLDHRIHGTAALAFKELAQFQGPALLVHNDATFSEADFDSIRHIGDSLKRGQAGKTGKYGLGFNSCYHLTEIPTFVSGKYLCMFDPAAKFLPGTGSGNPGKRIDYVAAEFAANYPDSAAPLQAFGCDMAQAFNGTLFRFALRNEEMAAVSGISKQVYSVTKMQELLKDLEAEAHLLLLFLKSIETLRIYEWLPNCDQPELLFTCSLKGLSPALRQERSMFIRAAQAVAKLAPLHGPSDPPPPHTTSTDTTDLRSALQSKTLVSSHFLLQVECSSGREEKAKDTSGRRVSQYLVAQGCSGMGTAAWELATQVSKQLGTNLVPWAAVALPLTTEGNEGLSHEEGQMFCCLPLPAASGLPAHVNGTFELSSNRRDLWHGSDLVGVGKQRAVWNAALLSEIAAPMYATVLAAAATRLGPSDAFFRLWPGSIETLRARETMAALVDPWLKAVAAQPVAYTRSSGGRWLPPQDVIFLDDRAAKDIELTDALLVLNLPIATMPQPITRLLVEEAVAQPRVLVPALLRQHTRVHRTPSMPAVLAAALLDFAASDVLEDDRESVLELAGVGLIPLMDGRIVQLGEKESSIFLPRGQEATLFKSAKTLMVDAAHLRPESLQKMTVIARQNLLNVRLIDARAAAGQLLSHALPATFRGKARISWSERENPTEEWIQQLWEWLGTQLTPGTESAVLAFLAWPIIPTTSGALVAPEPLQTSRLLASPNDPPVWGPEMLPALTKLGCEVIESALTGTASAAAGGNFALPTDGPGVLRALQNTFAKQQPQQNQQQKQVNMEKWFTSAGLEASERAELRAFLLQARWFSEKQGMASKMQKDQISFLCSLPIFSRASSGVGEQAQPAEFVDLMEQRFLLPPDLHVVISTCEAVLRHGSLLQSCGRDGNGVLLDFLGVRQLGKAEFYTRHVLPMIPLLQLPTMQPLAIQMLRELPVLHQSDPGIISLMRNTPLVVTASGAPALPTELYDPRNADLMLLLDPVKNFPAGEYGAVLDQLRVLGMRATAGRDTVLQAARDIDALAQSGASISNDSANSAAAEGSASDSPTASRARALLAYLDMEAPRLAKPRVTRQSRDGSASGGNGAGGGGFDLVDSVFSRVASFLGGPGDNAQGGKKGTLSEASKASMNNAQQAQQAAEDKEIQEFWAELRKLKWCPVQLTPPLEGLPWRASATTTAAPTAVRPPSDTWISCTQRLILDGEPRSPVLLHNMYWATPLEPEVLARQLAALGTAFQPPVKDTSLKQKLAEVVPQLYRILTSLPAEALATVRTVLADAPCIWIGDGMAPVSRVALKGPLNLSSAGVYVIPLELAPFRELFLALGIPASFSAEQYVSVLAAMHAATGDNHPLDSSQLEQALGVAAVLADMRLPPATQVYLPDERGVLRQVSSLMYNDAPWTSNSPPEGSHFVHPVISNDVAERLGVTSLQRCLLLHNADAFPMALTGAAVEAFGQSEALTTRLRHILEAYPDGSGVLMELLQNADDAGATSARFLLDCSQWGTDRVMGSKMAAWQGPALFAWNDAIFSPADVQNIARIGQDTKLSRPGATGRFGLGFNSVFHFSDLPSFVSGDLLVMFDPHASYLPGVTLAQPGFKIRFPSSPLVDHFPDSFQPYKVFGCDMHSTYDATLFRFPLRSAEVAPASNIKPQAYTPEDVLALFENFKAQAAHSLLFLKSLRRVELWVRENATSEPRQIFAGEVAPREGGPQPQAAVKAFVTEGGNRDGFYRRLRETPDSALPSTCVAVDVRLEDLSGHRDSNGQNGQHPSASSQQTWLVCNLLAGGAAKQLALEGANPKNATPRGWVPWAGVAAVVDPPGQLLGRAFCFLPLPALTHLPVHLNGLFELSSNRRDLWHGKDLSGIGKKRADWNTALLAEGGAVAHVRLIVAATKVQSLERDAFYALWPQQLNIPQPWDEVARAFYKYIANQPVLWSSVQGGRWVAPQDAIFVLNKSPEHAVLEGRIAAMLLEEGLPVVDSLPPALTENLLSCHPDLLRNNVLQPNFLRRHLGEKGRLLSGREDEPAVCLEYCLLDDPWQSDPQSLAPLMGVPLLPLADGCLGSLSARNNSLPFLLPTAPELLDLFHEKLGGRLLRVQQSSKLEGQLVALNASGTVNLRLLDATCIAEEVLPIYLPSSWRNQLFVAPNPEGFHAPDVDASWVLQLWAVLRADQAIALGAGALAEWPLIPAQHRGEAVFAAPSPSSGLVEEGAFTEAAMRALSQLGCGFVSMSVSQQLPEALRAACVHPATGPGVLAALKHAQGGVPAEMLEDDERDAVRAFMLQFRWFEDPALGATPTESSGRRGNLMAQLRSLPIYRCCTRGSRLKFTDVLGDRYLVPNGFVELGALPTEFIHAASPSEAQVLVNNLGVQLVELDDALVTYALPGVASLDPGVLGSLLLRVLRQVATGDASPTVLSSLRTTPCILTEAGNRVCPSQCFDPRSAGLQALLGKAAAFPASPVGDDMSALDGLVSLGMRTSITPDALLEVARQIHGEFASDREFSDADSTDKVVIQVKRAGALTAALNALALSDEQVDPNFWGELLDLSFLPVLSSPPYEGLPWPQGGVQGPPLGAPRRVRPREAAWLISASMGILDAECSDAFAEKLGWSEPLPLKPLAAQLVALGHLHPYPVKEESLLDQLSAASAQLYAALGDSELLNVPDEAGVVASLLASGSTVWVGDGFVSPNIVAVNAPGDVAPYIFAVSEELVPHEQLLRVMGIPTTPTVTQLIGALAAMAEDLGTDTALEPEALDTALLLVDGLGVALLESGGLHSADQTAYLPDSLGILTPASLLYVNDAPWLAHGDLKMVHSDVSAEVAVALGAQSLRYHHQVENQTSERLPCPPAALLRQLLRAQADPAMLALSDILEVADACGCRHVDFFLDARSHPSQSVLQPGLSALQGPALCVKLSGIVLSADELCRLQSPPGQFRMRQNTCKFGCGLLVSYTLSDVIQVISGDSFYIFDPSAKYLAMEGGAGGGADRRETAAMQGTGHAKQYRHAGTDLPRRFADQFAVWDWAGEGDISRPVNATLLRLPLRTGEQMTGGQAMVKQSWSASAVLDLLEEFKTTSSQALLFATSLSSIRILHQGLDSTTASPVLLKEATIKLPLPTGPAGQSGQSHSHRAWCEEREWRRAKPSSGFLGLSALGKQFSWLGGKDSGNKEKEESNPEHAAYRLTQHAIAVRSSFSEQQTQQESWLVSVCAGGFGSSGIASDKRYAHHAFNPQAAVAVRLEARDPTRPVTVASPGLLATMPLQASEKEGASSSAVNDALQGLPFTVCGFFSLARSGGRRLVAPPFAAEVNGDADPGSPKETTEHVKSRFNAALLRCTGQAAVVLLEKLVQQNQHVECRALYTLLPSTVLPATAGPELAAVCSQICSVAAKKRMWKLRRGDVANLSEGCFILSGAGLEELSSNARDFMNARLPLFDVPDSVKIWLEAWGVENLRGVSPETVRQELKAQAASGALARSGAFTPSVAAELLVFATSDVVPSREVIEASMNGDSSTVEDSGVVNLDALRDCKSLPCLDLMGGIQRLGTKTMLIVDSALDPTQDLFFTENGAHAVHADFLHPELATSLTPLLSRPSVAAALSVEVYSLEHLSKHLARVLPSHWAPVGMGGDAPMGVTWQDGRRGGPNAEFLQKLWTFLLAWRTAHVHEGGATTTWVDPLAGWALLPTCSGEVVRVSFRHTIITSPLTQAPSLMDADVPAEHAEPWRTKLVPALLEAKAFVLDPRFAACKDICNAAHADSPFAENEDALLIRKLKATSDLGQLQWNSLSPGGRSALVDWFAQQISDPSVCSMLNPPDVELLQQAPIYPTLAGSAVALLDGNNVPIAAGAVSGEALTAVLGSPEAISRPLQERFLQYNDNLGPLYRFLSVKLLEPADLLAAIMRQDDGFKTLSSLAQESCLAMVEREWESLKQHEVCTEAMAAAKFVTTATGILAAPTTLYDPTLPLLTKVFSGRPVFPHGKFASPRWIAILQSLGLKRSLDRTTFLDAAKGVERRALDAVAHGSSTLGIVLADPGQQPLLAAGEVWEAGSALARHLAEEGSDLLMGVEGRQLAEELREVAFVPARVYALGSAASSPTLSKYTNILLPSDAPLAWTLAPILDITAAPPPMSTVHASLRIRSPPPFKAVVEHLASVGAQGGQTTLTAWPFSDVSPQAVCERVLSYLDTEGLSSNQIEQLKGVALVPVANGTRLVQPSSLFVRLPVEGMPLIYELPPEFVSNLAVLKQLGLRDAPTAVDLLKIVCAVPLGSFLSTPLTQAMSKVLHYLLVEKSAPEAIAAADRGEIPVPDAHAMVTWPVSCVWGDAAAWMGFLPRLAAAGVSVAHPCLPHALCKALRIPSAGEVVQEQLDSSAALVPVANIQGVEPAEIAARLRERCVAKAVHAALEAEHRWVSALAPGHGTSLATLEEVTTLLDKAAAGLEFVNSCRTTLATVTLQGIAPLPGSISSVASFVAKGGSRFIIAKEPGVELSAALAAGVSKLLKAQTMLPIAPLFDASKERLVATAALMTHGNDFTRMDDNDVDADESSSQNDESSFLLGQGGAGGKDLLLLAASAGQLGALLTPQDIASVRSHPLRRFAAQELVAVRMPTGQLRYARVAANCAPPPGAAAFKVTLELSAGKYRDIMCTEILSFSSDIEQQQPGQIPVEYGQRPSSANGSSRPQTILASIGSGSSRRNSNNYGNQNGQEQAPLLGEKGPSQSSRHTASAPEVLHAVRSMLESAGVPLEHDASVLMEKYLALQQQLTATKHVLEAAGAEKRAAEEAATQTKSAWQCRICLSREVDTAMSGCGHMMCSECAGQLPRPVCPFCRKGSSITKLYR